jgi:6,7-dimethyl-8-ribityllumazine synthase
MSQGAPKDEKLDARGLRFAVVATRWNAEIVEKLAEGTLAGLKGAGGAVEAPYRCEGVFELAPLVARIARKGGIDGIVAIGCVIRGETDHYALLADETMRSLGQLALELGTNPRAVALTFGVLACENEKQARQRSEKGREFARTCVSQALALRAVGD